jgi:hypothetical protein
VAPAARRADEKVLVLGVKIGPLESRNCVWVASQLVVPPAISQPMMCESMA